MHCTWYKTGLSQQVELPKVLNGVLSAVADVYVLKLASLLFGSTAGGLAVSVPDHSHSLPETSKWSYPGRLSLS